VDRHLAFVSMPAHGHVTPTLPVVAELVRRGFRVSYATHEQFRPAVEKAGATLVPTGRPILDGPPAAITPAFFAALLQRLVADARTNLPGLQAHFRDDPAQAVCYDRMSLAGGILAATSGALDVGLLSTFAMNEQTDPLFRRAAAEHGELADPAIERTRAEMHDLLGRYGLTPRAVWIAESASLNIVFVPPEFQPAAETFDDRYRFVGPSPAFREAEAGWSPLADPVLYISLGTAFNDRPHFYRACLEAFGDGAWPVAMALGERVRIEDLGPIPGNVDARPWFPQPAVLRSASAFVSHAGMGSTMEALYYGIPLVCVPQMIEQDANARRVADLGLGVRLDPATVTPAELRAAVDRVTADADVRIALDRMRSAILAAGGAAAAADAIEAGLATSREADSDIPGG
jgi:MGT family glycosyltransferase